MAAVYDGSSMKQSRFILLHVYKLADPIKDQAPPSEYMPYSSKC